MAKQKKKVTVIDNPNEAEVLSAENYSYFSMVWCRFKRHKLATIGLSMLIFMVFFALCAPLIGWITGYPEMHSGLDKKLPPFSKPGIAVSIQDPDWRDGTKFPGGERFWFSFAENTDPKTEPYAEINMDTFGNPEYRKYYDYNLKPYGNEGWLDYDVAVIENDDGTVETKVVGLSEYFVGIARTKKSIISGDIITFAPPFETVDTSNITVKDGYSGPREIDLGPAPVHVLGSDSLGHDILVRLSYGARLSLFISIVVVLACAFIGIFLGALAGFYGKFIDALLMRVIELMSTIPTLPLFMVMSRFFGGSNPLVLIVILTVFGWTGEARMIRGMFLSLRSQEFAEAAKAIGAGPLRIMFRHLLPNSLAPIIVGMTLHIGGVIMTESSLSFLGLGVNPITTTTWGGMLNEAYSYMMDQPWPAIFSGLMIFITVLSVNFMGDGLQDALNPRLKV